MMNVDFTRDLDSISQDFRQLPLSQQLLFLEALENYRYQLQKRRAISDEENPLSFDRLDYIWRMLSHYLLNTSSLRNTTTN
uniref:Uncharacterized protein n=1 Tax=Roseihalotalea indica TaxID=2867963 RepID=A0AA49GLN8_9BACT|nr:hypothetical protein K4G66_00050 [Tunicatimonas sp. TK19036]